jgi:hypothetical protein
VPRELNPDQRQALQLLARHVISQLELRRQTRELAQVRQSGAETKRELALVRRQLAAARRQLQELKSARRKPARKGARASGKRR